MGTRGLGQLPPPAVPCSLRVCASLGRGPGVKPGQGDGSGLSSRCCVCPRKHPAETFQPHRGCSRPRGGRRGQAHGLSSTGPAADRMAAPPQDTLRWAWGPLGTSMGTRQGPRDLGRRCASVPSEPRSRWLWRACGAAGASGPVRECRQEPARRSASLAAPALDRGKQQRLPLNRFTLGLFLGMFRRITAAASRLLTADGADGSFYSLESLNARVRSMIPTHPALVLLWCQILLLVSHTDYRWWAEVQQTPRYVPCPWAVRSPLGGSRRGRSRASRRPRRLRTSLTDTAEHYCRTRVWSDKAFRISAAF